MDAKQTTTGVEMPKAPASRPTLLVATDGSEAAVHAGERAVGLARFLGAKLYVLDSYEAERVPFARSILRGSDRAFHLQAASTPLTQRLKLLALPSLLRLVSLVPPLREQVFLLLSQLWTGYRKSPAVADGGASERGPRAGDRAPYGHFERGPRAGESIFGGLGRPDHRLLVFEGLDPNNVGLGAAGEEIEALLDRYGATVEVLRVSAGNRSLHELYGARSPVLFLVRPDGHIAYGGGALDIVGLKVYLDRLFFRRPAAKKGPAARRAEARAASAGGGS
jgi:nucleotide-binding universal stress UspA family protein